jgi:hypothetical protein
VRSPRWPALALVVPGGLLLLGAVVGDWAVVEVPREVGADGARVVLTDATRTSGLEVARPLFWVGLLAVAVGAVQALWPRSGVLAVALGAAAVVLAVPGFGLRGVTAAPALAVVAGLLVAAGGLRAVRPRRAGGPAADAGAADAVDEWDLVTADAVAEGDAAVAEDDLGGSHP